MENPSADPGNSAENQRKPTSSEKATLLMPGAGLGHSRLAELGIDGQITLRAVEPLADTGTVMATGPSGAEKSGSLPDHTLAAACKYIVDREVGRGGMGVVHRVLDRDIRREVAMKLLLDDRSGGAQVRFLQEAQITGQLEHPNIPPIHDLGVDADGHLFFTMKMIHGRSLADIIDLLIEGDSQARSRFTLGALLNIFVGVCNGMIFAHSRGVIHRDLKPSNVMVGDFGETLVMDWGLAKVRAHPDPVSSTHPDRLQAETGTQAGSASNTRQGSILGTPGYMAPEQAMGDVGSIDERSDIYALGAILYELLTLERAVKGRNFTEFRAAILAGELVPPGERAPQRRISPELSAVVMKAMAHDPEKRYQCVEDLRRDIERFQEGFAVSAKEDTFLEAVVKLMRRNRQIVTVAAVFAVILAGVGLYSVREILHQKTAAVSARDLAEVSRQQAEKALAEAREAWSAEERQRSLVAAQQVRTQTDLVIDRAVEHARRRLQEIDANMARRLEPEQLRRIFSDLDAIIADTQDLVMTHPEYPILWFVRGQAQFLRLRDDAAIADFTKALAPVDLIALKDKAALAEAIAARPYLPQAALGRARARLRTYCSTYLVEQNFSAQAPEVATLAKALAREVQEDLTIAGEGEIPVLQGEVARLYLAYVNASSTKIWSQVVEPGARRLVEQGGRNEEAYFLVGLMTGFTYTESTRNFQASVDRYHCQPLAWFTLAWMHQEQQQWDKAQAALDEVFRIEPGRRDAWILQARIHRGQGRLEDALGDLGKVPEQERDGVDHLEMAWVLLAQKKPQEARTVLDQAIRHNPRFVRLYQLRVEVLLGLGEKDLARQDALRLVDLLAGMSRLAPRCLAWSLSRQLGMGTEADALWKACVKTISEAEAGKRAALVAICAHMLTQTDDAEGLETLRLTFPP